MTIVVVAITVPARQLLIEFVVIAVVVIAVLTCHLVSTSPPLVLLTK